MGKRVWVHPDLDVLEAAEHEVLQQLAPDAAGAHYEHFGCRHFGQQLGALRGGGKR